MAVGMTVGEIGVDIVARMEKYRAGITAAKTEATKAGVEIEKKMEQGADAAASGKSPFAPRGGLFGGGKLIRGYLGAMGIEAGLQGVSLAFKAAEGDSKGFIEGMKQLPIVGSMIVSPMNDIMDAIDGVAKKEKDAAESTERWARSMQKLLPFREHVRQMNESFEEENAKAKDNLSLLAMPEGRAKDFAKSGSEERDKLREAAKWRKDELWKLKKSGMGVGSADYNTRQAEIESQYAQKFSNAMHEGGIKRANLREKFDDDDRKAREKAAWDQSKFDADQRELEKGEAEFQKKVGYEKLDIQSEIAAEMSRQRGDMLSAETEEIRHKYENRIREARDEGKGELEESLKQQRDLELKTAQARHGYQFNNTQARSGQWSYSNIGSSMEGHMAKLIGHMARVANNTGRNPSTLMGTP
jgi:hypothetical protein